MEIPVLSPKNIKININIKIAGHPLIVLQIRIRG